MMNFMMVDINNYDIFLGVDFLIKMGVVVDVEKGMIHIRQGPRKQHPSLAIEHGEHVAIGVRSKTLQG